MILGRARVEVGVWVTDLFVLLTRLSSGPGLGTSSIGRTHALRFLQSMEQYLMPRHVAHDCTLPLSGSSHTTQLVCSSSVFSLALHESRWYSLQWVLVFTSFATMAELELWLTSRRLRTRCRSMASAELLVNFEVLLGALWAVLRVCGCLHDEGELVKVLRVVKYQEPAGNRKSAGQEIICQSTNANRQLCAMCIANASLSLTSGKDACEVKRADEGGHTIRLQAFAKRRPILLRLQPCTIREQLRNIRGQRVSRLVVLTVAATRPIDSAGDKIASQRRHRLARGTQALVGKRLW